MLFKFRNWTNPASQIRNPKYRIGLRRSDNYGVQLEITKAMVLDIFPSISTFNVWLPCVPSANAPPRVTLLFISVVAHSSTIHDCPFEVPIRRTEAFARALLTPTLQVAPTQYAAELMMSTGV